MSKPAKPDPYAQARAEFASNGVSIAAWAKANGFTQSLVYEVLAGRKKCLRGKSHKIAVLLGIKTGGVVDVARYRSLAAHWAQVGEEHPLRPKRRAA